MRDLEGARRSRCVTHPLTRTARRRHLGSHVFSHKQDVGPVLIGPRTKGMNEMTNTRALVLTTLLFASIASGPRAIAADGEFRLPDLASKLDRRQAGYYRVKIGDVNVTALSDGTLLLDPSFLHGDRETIDLLLAKNFVKPPIDGSVNAFLIEAGPRLILVDAGTGTLFGPAANKLPASLHAAGYQPEQITDVLITHIHTDHSGGLLVDGKVVYPNAVVHVEKRELDYWLDAEQMAKARPEHKRFFVEAEQTMRPFLSAKKVRTFSGATELFPGIRSIPAYGHTPGHTCYSLESKGEKIVFWGDLIHAAQVQFESPNVTILFDADPVAAAAARDKAFADAASNSYYVAPAHMSFPGIGRLRKEGSIYRWYPILYVNDAPTGSR
jgi:glyoxylase-like metal-dependent hydrolase (beta-lactamase superfamily II)